jgi:DNA-binding response OmpR family regulator
VPATADDGIAAPSKLVLIVEDEPALASSLAYHLTANGLRVVAAADGVEGLQRAMHDHPDLILLDVMLPRLDGLEVCRRVRVSSDVPIIMLSARAEETDRVVGLELGADDYVTKPFAMRELMAKVRGWLRRSSASDRSSEQKRLTIGDIVVDPRGRTVHRGDQEVPLKHREFDLLSFLAQNLDQVFTRAQLVERVWGFDYGGSTRTVDVHVRWLREKIEADPGEPKYLLTVRGVGYKLTRSASLLKRP